MITRLDLESRVSITQSIKPEGLRTVAVLNLREDLVTPLGREFHEELLAEMRSSKLDLVEEKMAARRAEALPLVQRQLWGYVYGDLIKEVEHLRSKARTIHLTDKDFGPLLSLLNFPTK